LKIAEKIGADKVEDIGSIEPAELATYDTLIVGAPTWYRIWVLDSQQHGSRRKNFIVDNFE